MRYQAEEPENTYKPLAQIVEQLEKSEYESFSKVSKGNGHWEVKVSRNGVECQLAVDPETGKAVTKHLGDPERLPPKDAIPLSKLLKALREDKGFQIVDELSFERRHGEIKVHQERQQRELHLDPLVTKIVAERIDDQ